LIALRQSPFLILAWLSRSLRGGSRIEFRPDWSPYLFLSPNPMAVFGPLRWIAPNRHFRLKLAWWTDILRSGRLFTLSVVHARGVACHFVDADPLLDRSARDILLEAMIEMGTECGSHISDIVRMSHSLESCYPVALDFRGRSYCLRISPYIMTEFH
jgi:hypothetical protein